MASRVNAASVLTCVVVWTLVVCAGVARGAAAGQRDDRLVREYVHGRPLEESWGRIKVVLSTLEAIVDEVDNRSHLASITLPIRPDEVDGLVVEDVPPRSMRAHLVVWARSSGDDQTRLYLRATFATEGVYFHSSGALESRFMDALLNPSSWRASKNVHVGTIDYPLTRTWETLRSQLDVANWSTKFADASEGVLTASAAISHDDLAQYVTGPVQPYHAGVAYMTVRLVDVGEETRIIVRCLIVQPGAYSPPDLSSNGSLERQLEAVLMEKPGRLPLGIGDLDHLEWPSMRRSARLGNDAIRAAALEKFLPVSFDEAWDAVLSVATQAGPISDCDRKEGRVTYLAAHPVRSTATFSVHPLTVVLDAGSNFGVEVLVGADARDHSRDEIDRELLQVFERLATQSLLKERLRWLLGPDN